MLKAISLIKDLSNSAKELLKNNNIDLEFLSQDEKPNIQNLINIYDILIIGIRTKITKEIIKKVKAKKIIATLSIGLDHIDKEVFESELIKVVNCSTANVSSVAEHILSLILALNKKLIESNNLSNEGKNKTFLTSRTQDIFGLTLGVIGAGKISRALINFSNAFKMKILCFTKNPKKHNDLSNTVQFVDLDYLLKNSDIISVNIPLNEETEFLINKEKINLIKNDATFINTSRAQLVDIKALFEKADKYPTFKVGLDIDVEDYIHLIRPRKNVIITPHIAGVSKEAIERMDNEIAENIIDEVKTKCFFDI